MSSTGSTTADISWLPSDADEQMALGFRIISNAYKTRVNSQEAEIRSLKAQNAEKSEQLALAQKKNSTLEVQLIDSTQRGNQLADENKQLVATIKKLHRDINRLETLKKAVLNSIQEDRAEADDSHKFYAPEDVLQTTAPRTMQEIKGEDTCTHWGLSKFNSTDNFFLKTTSNNTTNSMATGNGKVVDGKTFFKDARNRLTYEQFNTFLANIKRLNNHQQSEEDTLVNAQQLFGEENSDLLEDFKVLLVRHSNQM